MKTSFYFVLWIVIYPVLEMIGGQMVAQHGFIMALLAVFGISFLLNKLMPRTLVYEHMESSLPVLEDIYKGDVGAFGKRLVRDTTVNIFEAIYFVVVFAIILLSFIYGAREFAALIVFGWLGYGVVTRAMKFHQAQNALALNPTPQECMTIANNLYNLDYAAYYNEREGKTYEEMLPPRPQFYTAFQVATIIFAVVSALFGLVFIALAAMSFFGSMSIVHGLYWGMNFLYGSLALYFGVRDVITTVRQMKHHSSPV